MAELKKTSYTANIYSLAGGKGQSCEWGRGGCYMAGQGQQWEKSLNFVKDHIFTVFTRQFSADQSVRWAVGQSSCQSLIFCVAAPAKATT